MLNREVILKTPYDEISLGHLFDFVDCEDQDKEITSSNLFKVMSDILWELESSDNDDNEMNLTIELR